MDLLVSTLELRLERLTEALTGAAEALHSMETGVERDRIVAVKINVNNRLSSFTTDLNRYLSGDSANVREDLWKQCRDVQIKAEDVLTELEIAMKLYCHEGDNNNRTRLPKLELGKYNGDVLKWNTFWDKFAANVDNKDIANVEKLSYLLASLEGPALQAVEGLETTNLNYPIAVDILSSRFGKPSKVIDAHNEALQKLTVAKDLPEDCRCTLNAIEKHLRVLEALGEKVDASHLRVIILNKFPSKVVYQVRLMAIDDSFSAIRKALDAVITAMESSKSLVVLNPESSVIPVKSSMMELQHDASTATLQIATRKRRKTLSQRWHEEKHI
ncbi:uncharacterized protein LOC125225042 [Leguminivora glycinivorella]|uniref:uncharacterized protein LOC125225042 n=1 Tax=Leguminivora glycinivorella TaxID=1035111 RepID=UPI00200CBABD|nr:uncharacterized protein LOC125225042 [Leguminivora glycinivorella]